MKVFDMEKKEAKYFDSLLGENEGSLKIAT